MPTLKQPPDDVALEVPVSLYYARGLVSTHICIAFALVAILALICSFAKQTRVAPSPLPKLPNRPQASDIKHSPSDQSPLDPAASCYRGPRFAERLVWAKQQQEFDPHCRLLLERQLARATRTVGIAPPEAVIGPLRAMEGSDGEPGKGHRPWSALTASGSVGSAKSHNPTAAAGSSVTVTARRERSRSPLHPSQSSGMRQSRTPDGTDGRGSEGKGMGCAGGHVAQTDTLEGVPLDGEAEMTSRKRNDTQIYPGPTQEAPFPSADFTTPIQFSRPPPPLPLTPPTLSDAVFPFENRRLSSAASISPEPDTSFVHRPSPKYWGSSTSTDMPGSIPPSAAAVVPRHRFYTKSVAIGIPITTTKSAASFTATMTSSGMTNTFSPSSYPPTSPLLPPPPPGYYNPPSSSSSSSSAPPSPPPPHSPQAATTSIRPGYRPVGGPGGPGVYLPAAAAAQREKTIHVRGEIISVVDDAGHGWKRHTRVYGGGVCLACLAAAGAGAAGGFYGETVPLEDRR